MLRLSVLFITVFWGQLVFASGIYQKEIRADMKPVYQAVYKALESQRFWVVFEADIGSNMQRFSERWGDDYNKNALEGYQSMVICNAGYANRVGNADPKALALCPMRVNLIHKDGVTTVLFARPGVFVEDSPARDVINEIEEKITGAIDSVAENFSKKQN